ncbi:MAG: polysaccharide deacetylase family protein [Flavobacteriaceae bacterium]|nr:polysaccharide deacetylase family protein [Flavobacteriaceae bacterium]
MYHKVSDSESEGLTISALKLEAQLQYLSEKGYRSYHLSELMDLQKLPSKKSVVITFDDGYVSQLEYAVPLLEKYGLKATFFIPLKYMGATDAWNEPSFPLLSSEQLKSLDPSLVELGYHSFAHQKYTELSLSEIEEDTQKAFEAASNNELPLTATLAYPYGKFPRKNPEKEAFCNHLREKQFVYGLRIGNRINQFPFKNPFEINRIDVKGEFSLRKFKRKLKFGKFF